MKIPVKTIVDEDFVNYKKASMFVAFPKCTFKCEKECGVRCCQNSALAQSENIEIESDKIVERYVANDITSAIVIGGLEPLDSLPELVNLVSEFRSKTQDDIVIYTGYTEDEVGEVARFLGLFKNVVFKYGRFSPNQEHHFDEVLGVELASPNQYAKKVG